MPLFYLETGLGACIKSGKDETTVKEAMLKVVGTYNGVQLIRLATKQDLEHVKAMGGRVDTETGDY